MSLNVEKSMGFPSHIYKTMSLNVEKKYGFFLVTILLYNTEYKSMHFYAEMHSIDKLYKNITD